ncbi:ABC transporter permease [Exiguobacterium aurantiacum]|uniref:ABC transporter permease n=1 Tax=Exiguobacterium aurantiacum TaxID=33987 RepID=A0ABY5FMW0_9BACL|nr:ABC transporter permease [Exiguobacterium aurantiacum]UTT42796.1 ABC transporter permease [Exiguobacterium aurantiacum]
MNERQLFVRRVRAYMFKQWKTWRLILDWTVILYGGIPFAIFLGYQYRLLWQGEIEWVSQVPMLVWTFLLIVLFLQDRFFVWMERADVTLIARRTLIQVLKRYSLLYHVIKLGLKVLFIMLAFTPVLRLDEWSGASILAFGMAVLLLAWIHMWTWYQLTVRRVNWVFRILVTCMVFLCLYALLVDSPLWAVVLGSSLVAFAMYLGEGWLSRHPYLSRELERGETVRDAFDRALLSTSGAIEKPSRRKRPLYRPRPNRFGTARRTSAILLYIRTPRHRNLWLRLIPVAVTGMVLVPSWFKLLIPLYVGYVMWQERQAFKQEMERHPFFRAIQERTDL